LLEEKGIQVRLKSLAQNIVQKYLSTALQTGAMNIYASRSDSILQYPLKADLRLQIEQLSA